MANVTVTNVTVAACSAMEYLSQSWPDAVDTGDTNATLALEKLFNVTNDVNATIDNLMILLNATSSNPNITFMYLINVLYGDATTTFKPPSKALFWFFIVVYAMGIIGNAVAMVTLRVGERRVRNRKHLLLLSSLAANDLVALVGMMCAMLVGEMMPEVKSSQYYCASRVVLRIFGIGSVCIAVTMALERYLALTRPFFYQKQVTHCVIRLSLLMSWVGAALLTCAPVLGLGMYYAVIDGQGKCVRYRNAESDSDIAYAAFYVFFGTVLCVVLVYCNLAVIRALYAITAPRSGGPVVRRVSKSSCRQRERERCFNAAGTAIQMHHNAATAEEVAFSRLMAMLSVLFMFCWLPQMVTSALYLILGSDYWEPLAPLANLSDLLMLLNYVLDPVLYVHMRRRQPLDNVFQSVVNCFKRGHKRSTDSMSLKTSCCPQETLVLSDSSGAEARPLRPFTRNASGLKFDD